MTTTNAASDRAPTKLGLVQALDLPAMLWLGLAAALLLAYGYEIFNFNLTIDEELHAAGGVGRREWIAQGRWGMALVGTVLLRNPVGPVVSTFLGVVGTAIGLVLALRWTLRLDARATAVVTALAVSTPTLAFIFTFSTIAFGIGVAFVAIALGARYASFYTFRGAALACALGALSIAIYQPFVVAIAMLAAVNAIRDAQVPRAAAVRRYAYWIACVAGSFLLYALVSAVAVKLQPINVEYMGKYVDLAGLAAEPAARLDASYMQMRSVLALDPEMFGATSPWLGITLVAAAALALVVPLLRGARARLVTNAAVLSVIAAIVVLAGVIAGEVPPLRSMVYLPIAVAVVAAVACGDAAPPIRAAFWTLCFLAVVGNATIANHLFASAADAELQDKLVAREVMRYVSSVDPALIGDRKPIKIEPVGVISWPETALRHVRSTFGASFFEWDGGNRMRIAAYLRLNGVNATWDETPAERARSYEVARTMPAWPHEGWVRFAAPDLLVIKFGDYTTNQAYDLCIWGVKALCANPADNARK